VSPIRIVSPPCSRRRPVTRSWLTNVPLRQAVVGDRPRAADPLEDRVQARDLAVPLDPHVGALVAAERQRGALHREGHDPLSPDGVAQQQERDSRPLRLEARLQLGGRRAVQRPWVVAAHPTSPKLSRPRSTRRSASRTARPAAS
jgi:hypothetical protein